MSARRRLGTGLSTSSTITGKEKVPIETLSLLTNSSLLRQQCYNLFTSDCYDNE